MKIETAAARRSAKAGKISARIAALLGTSILATAVTTSTAEAALNYTYNGSDPHTTGCDQNRYSVKQMALRDPANGALVGYAYMRYSPSCETQWVTVNYNSGYTVIPYIWRQGQTGTDLSTSNSSPGGGTHWTKQLTGMRTSSACGGVHVYRGNYLTHIGWNYLGCA